MESMVRRAAEEINEEQARIDAPFYLRSCEPTEETRGRNRRFAATAEKWRSCITRSNGNYVARWKMVWLQLYLARGSPLHRQKSLGVRADPRYSAILLIARSPDIPYTVYVRVCVYVPVSCFRSNECAFVVRRMHGDLYSETKERSYGNAILIL